LRFKYFLAIIKIYISIIFIFTEMIEMKLLSYPDQTEQGVKVGPIPAIKSSG
jgi:hypothetical protein